MRKIPALFLCACCTLAIHAQSTLPEPDAPPSPAAATSSAAQQDPSAGKARAALDAMIQALGGEHWLNLQNSFTEGRIAAFFHGKPTGVTIRYWEWHTPAAERVDLTEKKSDKHDWIQIYRDDNCSEITFRGVNPLPKDQCTSAIRRRNHSIDAAVHVWMRDPTTILIYDGQTLAERHLAEQVTLLNTRNDSITIQMDADTHLPLRCTWSWRDPTYHDKDEDVEEYADYHLIDGLPTPFSVTRLHNGDMTQQRFVLKAAYNVALPANWFDVSAAGARFRK